MTQKFYRETGAILNPQKTILHLVEGTAGLVVFPQEVSWKIHTLSPGQLFAFSHVHPDHMPMLSGEDESTLRAWSMALYPYPMRLITITLMRSDPLTKEQVFRETCYLGLMEAKETWLLHKDQPRKFEIIKEWERDFFIEKPKEAMNDWYGLVLIRKSYKFDKLVVN